MGLSISLMKILTIVFKDFDSLNLPNLTMKGVEAKVRSDRFTTMTSMAHENELLFGCIASVRPEKKRENFFMMDFIFF